jgi:L-malate glycosyltransferase
MKYHFFIAKNKLENIFLFPFIILGRVIAFLNPLKSDYDIFLFFPFYHVGGAEKVHAEVAKVAGNKKSIIFFTKKSDNNLFYTYFTASGCTIKDVSAFTDNKWLYFNNLIYRGILSGYINKQKNKTVVFNGQCNFGYKISPWIKKPVTQIELIHAFNSFSLIRLPFIRFYKKTVMISKVKIEEHIADYKKRNVPAAFINNITYIINGVTIPENPVRDFTKQPLTILYAGRSTEEKRVPLIAQLAKNCFDKGLPVNFIFMGDMGNAIPQNLLPYCNCIGNLSNPDEIQSWYNKTAILILLSNTEGFPMVVMEAMASGCAVIATAVGDIPVHVKENINGFVLTDVFDEQKILTSAIEGITECCNNPAFLKKVSINNRKYAEDYFSNTAFHKRYAELFNAYL